MPQGQKRKGGRRVTVVVIITLAALVLAGTIVFALERGNPMNHSTQGQPVILYVNQGNGVVNGSGFGKMLGVASSHGFNTVFFQVYRQGLLLFSSTTLRSFVAQAHEANLSIFFALFITNSNQELPSSVYGLGEDGISLDMSGLSSASQRTFLGNLKASFSGETAVTTTDFSTTLKPDLLILETYNTSDRQYIHSGIIAGVEVLATTSLSDYNSQLHYALQNSDGVMVFDYYGLEHDGY